LVDLLAEVVEPRDCGLVKNVGKIVDVVRWAQLIDRLGAENECEHEYDNDEQDIVRAGLHSTLIV
jgi:hypothetical protein